MWWYIFNRYLLDVGGYLQKITWLSPYPPVSIWTSWRSEQYVAQKVVEKCDSGAATRSCSTPPDAAAAASSQITSLSARHVPWQTHSVRTLLHMPRSAPRGRHFYICRQATDLFNRCLSQLFNSFYFFNFFLRLIWGLPKNYKRFLLFFLSHEISCHLTCDLNILLSLFLFSHFSLYPLIHVLVGSRLPSSRAQKSAMDQVSVQ